MNPFDILISSLAFGTAPGLQISMQNNARKEKLKALDMYAKQQELSFQQKTESNLDLMKNVLDKQLTQASVRGVGLGSASFNAIQRDTYNKGAKNQNNISTENEIAKENIKIEKSNVNNAFYAQLFGDAVNWASLAAGAAK